MRHTTRALAARGTLAVELSDTAWKTKLPSLLQHESRWYSQTSCPRWSCDGWQRMLVDSPLEVVSDCRHSAANTITAHAALFFPITELPAADPDTQQLTLRGNRKPPDAHCVH